MSHFKAYSNRKNTLTVNSIATETFTMSEDYQGTFTISGELFVKNNSSISANVSIGKNLVVEEGIFVKDFIQLGESSERMIKSTPTGFGVNVETPNAILDICGNNSRIMNVNSTSAVVNSTLLRNVHDDTFSIDLSNTHASMDFLMGGNTFSIAYNTLDDFVSINKDVSLSGFLYASDNIISLGNLVIEKESTLSGNTSVGENLQVGGGVDVVNDISMGGDLTIGGTISLTGSLQLEGDISTNGNVILSGELNTGEGASFGGDVQINGNMVVHDISSQSLYSESDVVINNGGLYMNNLLTDDAIIRKYNNDETSSSFTIPEDAIYLNHNVVIRGNVYIDGSTNLVGNITAQSGTSGGSSVINGVLKDLSGTDRTQMYVNFNQDISDTDLKNAGFYVYNRPGDDDRDGFIKISDVSLNRMSFRSIGSERNVIAMDFESLKNEGKSGLMVLKHDISVLSNNNDNYRIISSHTNPHSIDVSNSLHNINDLNAINVIYCEGNIISDKTIHAIDISAQTAYLENIELSKDLTIGGNINFSDETHTTGNIVSLSLLEDITIGGNINFSDETHTTGNIVSLSLLEDITIGGNIHLSDETHTTGNIYNLSINESIDISNWLSVSNESMYFHRGQLWLPFGSNNQNIQSVTQAINSITSSFQDSSIRPKQNNIFGNNLDLTTTYVNTFETWVSVHQGLHIGDTSLCDNGISIYTGIPYNLTCVGDVSTNGNVFTDFLHLRDSLFVTNDISTNGNIYGSNINIFEDLSINGNIYVHNNVFVTNDLSINANLYVTSSTFLNDLSVNDVFIGNLLTINGNISCSDDISTKTQTISESLIIGGDDTIDSDVLYVNGDISHNGNIVSNNIFVKENLEVTVDTSINDLYIYGNIKTSTRFDDILNVGNDSTIGQTIMNVNGDISHNGNLVSNTIFVKENLEVTVDTSINDLYIYGDIKTSTRFDDILNVGNDSTVGQTIMNVNGDISHNGNLVSNTIFVKENLEVTVDTSINDLYIYGDIKTSTRFDDILNVGNDSTVGQTIMNVNGDISHNGNIVSNNIFVKENLEVTVDTSINDLYIYGDIKTSTRFDDILNVGNDSTIGQTIMNVNGNINLEGTLFSNNALIDGTLTCTDNASIGKNLTVNGDIDLNDGSIQVQYDQSSCTISPFILYNLRDVSQNIQKVLDDIAIEADVRQSANNVFTGDNTFEGALSANTFNILREVNASGTLTGFYEDRSSASERAYFQKHVDGRIVSSDNIICKGETFTKYIFSSTNPFVRYTNGDPIEGSDFFNMYSLGEIIGNSVSTETYVEGGKIECLDLSLGNQLNLYGEAIIHGTLSIPTFGFINLDGTNFTSNDFKVALGAAAGTTTTVYAGETAFGNVVNFNNDAEFNENLRIYKDIVLQNSLVRISQSTLGNLATISENVQDRLDTLKTQTNFISTNANDTNVANTLNIGRDLNVTNEVSFNNVLTTHDSVVMNQTDASSYGLANTIQSNTVSSDITHLDDTIYMDSNYNVYKHWTHELLATSTLPTNDISINQVAHFNYNNNKATIFIDTDNNYEIYHDFSDVPIKNLFTNDYSFNDIHLLSINSTNITTVFVHNDELHTLSIDNPANPTIRNVTNLEKSCNHITSHIDSDDLAFSTGSEIYTSYNDIINDSNPISITRDNSDNFIVGSDTNNNAFVLTYDDTGVFYNDTTQIIADSNIKYIDVPKNKDLLLLSKANEFKVYKFLYDISSIELYHTNNNEFVNRLQPVFFENFVVTLAYNLQTINYYKPQYTQYNASTNYDTTYAIGENIHMTIQDVNGPLPHKDNVVGTLTLKHSQKGGASSIVFPNMSQPGDFATLEYHDSDRNMDSMHLQYDRLSGKQNSVLHIGTKQTSQHTKDNIVMRTGGSLILDAGKYVTEDMSGLFQSSVLPSAFTKVENGEVIIQPNGGNVGIGTTHPTTDLHIHKRHTESDNYPSGSLKFSTANNNELSWDVGEIQSYIAAGPDGATDDHPGGLAFKTKNRDGNANSALTTKMVIDASGNVGIGTTRPAHSLDVNGTIHVSNYITLDVSLTAIGESAALSITTGNQNTAIGESAGSSITEGNYNTAIGRRSLMTVTSSDGNTAVGRNALFNANTDYNTAIGYIAGQPLDSTYTGGYNVFVGSISGKNAYKARYCTFLGATTEVDNSANKFDFSTAIGYGATIDASNQIVLGRSTENVYIPGNLGIGTTSPQGTLDVSGALFVTSIQYRMPFGNLQDNSGNVRIDIVNNSTNTNTKTEHYAATHHFKNLVNLGGNTTVDISGDLIVKNNVGIGTTIPTTALTIRKAIDTGTSTGSDEYGKQASMIEFKSHHTTDTESVKSAIYSGVSEIGQKNSNAGFMAFHVRYADDTDTSGTMYERLRIEKNGNVGIGTTSPIAKLDVSGDLHVQGEIYQNGHNFVMAIENENPTEIPGIFPDSQWGRALVSTTNVLNINHGADWTDGVNIQGKLNVVAKDISGQNYSLGQTTDASLNLAEFYHKNGNNSYLTIIGRRYDAGSDWHKTSTRIQQKIDVTPQAYLEFNPPGNNYGIALGTGPSPVERLTIDYSGNVGIGTTNPTEILHVNGNLKVTGTITGTSNSNAATATKLETARTIGGVSFDGTSDINLKGVNQAGDQNTSGNAATATKLETARTIGGVSFDGTANINLKGVNQAGDQNTSGNAATATKLETARTIGGVSFDGTANINLKGVNQAGDQNTTGNAATATKIDSITNGNIVQLTETQTLTNKTLTSPTITSPTITGTGTITAQSFNANSDYRLKENVQTISGGNYTVDNLRPVSYELKDTKKPHIGFIAHELQEHFPTAVNGEKDGETMQTVNYLELIPVLVKEIQDLKKEVKSLKSEISILKS
jgi:hypothetical protein